MLFSDSPPLYALPQLPQSLAVSLHLHDPLLKSGSIARRVALQLVDLAATAELVLAREATLADAVSGVDCLVFGVEERVLFRGADVEGRGREYHSRGRQSYLSPHLAPLFPRLARHLGVPLPDAASKSGAGGRGDVRSHFHAATALNQVVAMALQLRADVALENHKYMAHQLALLYQSLTTTGPPLSRHQARIQREFESIKAVTSREGVEAPKLADAHREWYRSLTADVLSESLFAGTLGSLSQGGVFAALEKAGGV
ncbi:hypothetical protein M427DRAFT_50973 [Gonapodya prolifera JEL478]|uniref:Uncharacterized protein n=1 Tax=Gonapodya prolifera (strain JEL478) TaxID=1344416 RepID=A0A139AXW4_GONPJ|nr:hypothetical protein M427DRAFT_50973 [Gonapodya prolifera JEL478]|eukprot:KXS21547.1 hypothetical protein M427DRAFT_50973 [Gonapodya prolifera JEL478]